MQYLPPFETIKTFLTLTNIRGKTTATATIEGVQAMIRALLAGMDFDEDWYLTRNPDIAQAVSAGTFRSGKEHFLSNGYFEGRLPFPIEVDNDWYLSQYPEVADAVAKGVVNSAQQHFDQHGYREGRRPRSL
ncbi:MAG: hypothetical protein AB7F35_06045 [Acetobacteraceae bacterium]